MEKNLHYTHGLGLDGLCHNLQNHPQEWAAATFTKAYDPERLAAIAQQADNVKLAAITGIRTLGALLVAAIQSGELEDKHTINIGFLVEFLGEIVDQMDMLQANAEHGHTHGTLL